MLMRFFKESGFDKVVGTDCSSLAPALYEADAYYLVPRMSEPGYLEKILSICKKEKIHAVLPLQEDELHLIAQKKEFFLENQIVPIVSKVDSIDLCRDKMRFYHYLKNAGIPVLPSYDSLKEFQKAYEGGKECFPVFVKPIAGAGSIGAMKVNSMELLTALMKDSEDPLMIQRFSQGKEYGADIYADLLTGRVTDIFLKEKLRMRAGETEKSVSVKKPEVFELIERTLEQLSLCGPVDMDIFENNGSFFVSEINPRFGGGYPHAFACDINFPQNILMNLMGKENEVRIGAYEEGVYVLKYSDIRVQRFQQ